MARRFAGHFTRRDLAQFRVEQGKQFLRGFGVAGLDRVEDLRSFVWLCHSRVARRWSVRASYWRNVEGRILLQLVGTARCAVRAAYQRLSAWGRERLSPAGTRAETSQRNVCCLNG